MKQRLGPADLEERELRGFETEGRYVLVTRLDGQLYALDDQCNHAGCLLSGGFYEGDAIVCPCHEFAFDPRTGENVTRPRLCGDQPVFPLRIENGEIVVELEPYPELVRR